MDRSADTPMLVSRLVMKFDSNIYHCLEIPFVVLLTKQADYYCITRSIVGYQLVLLSLDMLDILQHVTKPMYFDMDNINGQNNTQPFRN